MKENGTENRSENLQDIVKHAYKYSEYYRKIFETNGVEPSDISCKEDLRKLPVSKKTDLKENLKAMETPLDPYKIYNSTGSTGDSTGIKYDEQAADWREAVTLRTEVENGYLPRRKIVEYWGMEQTRLGDFLRPKKVPDKDSSLEDQKQLIENYNPDYLIYGAHVLFRIANKYGKIDADIKKIFSNGELMTPNMQSRIEEVFECEIVGVYETAEVGQIGTECQEGNFHINEELTIVEILGKDGKSVEVDEKGLVTVTSLANRACPIIRYQLGDVAKKVECDCGRSSQSIELIGRKEDFIETETNLLAPKTVIDNITQFQELEKFILVNKREKTKLKYLPGDSFTEETKSELVESLEDLGLTNIETVERNDIPRQGWKAAPIRNKSGEGSNS